MTKQYLASTLLLVTVGIFPAVINNAYADLFTEVIIQNSFPALEFRDTGTTGNDWEINADQGAFRITDIASVGDVLSIHRNANNIGSVVVNTLGDVTLGNNAVSIDRTNKRLGIGITSPQDDLHIANSDNPSIRLEQLPGGFGEQAWELVGNELNFYVRNIDSDTLPFRVLEEATNDMLVVDAGAVGVGTSNPAATLEVTRNTGNTKIQVTETSATAAPRTLFELNNPGNTKFEITNSDANVSWAFTNSGTDFRVSRQGSGVVEFRVNNAGDAFLEGMLTENSDINSKQNIVAVDPMAVLKKLTSLPISEWSYKDTPDDRHIGPMAQDFFAAFGLGNNDKGIGSLDSAGVALAAIKALAEQNQQLRTNQENQTREIRKLTKALAEERLQRDQLRILKLQLDQEKRINDARFGQLLTLIGPLIEKQ